MSCYQQRQTKTTVGWYIYQQLTSKQNLKGFLNRNRLDVCKELKKRDRIDITPVRKKNSICYPQRIGFPDETNTNGP